MASFRLNMARIRGLPPVTKVLSALKAFGMPREGGFGVLSCVAGGESLAATIVYRSTQTVHQLDRTGQAVIPAAVERIAAYPLEISPAKGRLELYQGCANGIERMQVFFARHLSLPVSIERIELDVVRALEKLSGRVEHFQLRAAHLESYSHSAYMIGTYHPRFLDSEHGLEFLAEHDEGVLAVSVRFAAKNGPAGATLARNACFTYWCDEEDHLGIQGILRRLL